MNVSLPPAMKEWVDKQVQTGGYETASEYVRQLLREEQRRQAQQKLEDLLVEGIESGPSTPMTRKDWDDVRQEGRRRLAARKRA